MNPELFEEFWDVVVIGAGGAGCAAAIEAKHAGCKVVIVTKDAKVDSNTSRAQGGIQAAVGIGDSVESHFQDTWIAGKQRANKKLTQILAEQAPKIVSWLEDMGVEFDRDPAGDYALQTAAGLSHPRVLTCGDRAGKGLMMALLAQVEKLEIPFITYALVTACEKQKNRFLIRLKDDRALVAKCVVLATGGTTRREKRAGFERTNNEIQCALDGTSFATQLGAKVIEPDLMQYHPTGVLLPKALRRHCLPEAMRVAGATLLNREGEHFVDAMLTREKLTQAIVYECEKGNGIPDHEGYQGVWLDTPLVDRLKGTGYLEANFPSHYSLFKQHGHDLSREPVLVYPVLHYSLGGVDIDQNAETCVTGLFAAGEVAWGVHGDERLMGNSLSDIFVFGRLAGKGAAERAMSL